MSQIAKVWSGILFSLAVLTGLGVWRGLVFWNSISPVDQKKFLEILEPHFSGMFLILFLFCLAVLAGIIHTLHAYVFPVIRLDEEINLISSVNSSHRIKPQGALFCRKLARSINSFAEKVTVTINNIDNEISYAKAEIEREKNILAAFIGELEEGVIICTAEGSIMFYNRRAKELFAERREAGDTGVSFEDKGRQKEEKEKNTFIGIGRSIFNIIDKNLIVHALDEVAGKLHDLDSFVTSYFVVATPAGKLLRIETVPVLGKKLQLTGFVFSATDITERLQKDNKLSQIIDSLIKKIRGSVGGIRSSVETMLEYPSMEKEQLTRFKSIIHNESLALGNMVDEAATEFTSHMQNPWPLVPMLADDIIETVRRKAANALGISLYIENKPQKSWVKVESYCANLIILFVLKRLKEETDNLDFFCKTEKRENFVNIYLSWRGSPVFIKTIRDWSDQPLLLRNEGLDLSLREVLDNHNASLWLHSMTEHKDRSALRIIFPACEHEETTNNRSITIMTEQSRPVFYDFDLFHQQGQNPEIDNQPLTALKYTVFDTETTGLAPREGDEIISIAAVRTVNGQILRDELFDQLVDPKRDIPLSSIRIHGIQPEMVKGQPVIEEVLPIFHDFCGRTVLVAHNAAFDMLMLKMKEPTTGVRFINPVLDTLLLWDVLHPAQEKHNFGKIAEMLGVRVVGRHTALGDALATAEVFIQMIPLLAKRGIHTLKDAREASQKSKFAKLEY